MISCSILLPCCPHRVNTFPVWTSDQPFPWGRSCRHPFPMIVSQPPSHGDTVTPFPSGVLQYHHHSTGPTVTPFPWGHNDAPFFLGLSDTHVFRRGKISHPFASTHYPFPVEATLLPNIRRDTIKALSVGAQCQPVSYGDTISSLSVGTQWHSFPGEAQ